MILLLGSTGFVGQKFALELNKYGLAWKAIRSGQVNLTDYRSLTRAIHAVKGKFLINCAGFTGQPNVDACELHKAECLAGNAVIPGAIAEACRRLDMPWGHISSGCIFTGRRSDGLGFTELDEPNFTFRQNNCSFYSGTKALGEEILASESNCYIWRMRIPFDRYCHARNYLQKLILYDRLLEAENSLSNLDEFVSACIDCYRKKKPYGIYNLTNPGSVRTSEICNLISSTGVSKKRFQFFENEEAFMTHVAKTPRSSCVLDSSKAIQAGLNLTPVLQAIEHCLANWISDPN